MKEFKSWRDIKDWAEENGFKHLPTRLQANNDYWMSSGEFGRNQVAICDALRFADSEEDRLEIARTIEKELSEELVDQILADIENEENYEKI